MEADDDPTYSPGGGGDDAYYVGQGEGGGDDGGGDAYAGGGGEGYGALPSDVPLATTVRAAPAKKQAAAPRVHADGRTFQRDRKPEAWYDAMRTVLQDESGALLVTLPSDDVLIDINARFGAGRVNLESAKAYAKERRKTLMRALKGGRAVAPVPRRGSDDDDYVPPSGGGAGGGALSAGLATAGEMADGGEAGWDDGLVAGAAGVLRAGSAAPGAVQTHNRRGPKAYLARFYAAMRGLIASGRAVSDEELLQMINLHVDPSAGFTLRAARTYMVQRQKFIKRKADGHEDEEGAMYEDDSDGEEGEPAAGGDEDDGGMAEDDELADKVFRRRGAGRPKSGGASQARPKAMPEQAAQVAMAPVGHAAGAQEAANMHPNPAPVAGFTGVYAYPGQHGYYHAVPVPNGLGQGMMAICYMGTHDTAQEAAAAHAAAKAKMAVSQAQLAAMDAAAAAEGEDGAALQ
jgi:hypothetical protein